MLKLVFYENVDIFFRSFEILEKSMVHFGPNFMTVSSYLQIFGVCVRLFLGKLIHFFLFFDFVKSRWTVTGKGHMWSKSYGIVHLNVKKCQKSGCVSNLFLENSSRQFFFTFFKFYYKPRQKNPLNSDFGGKTINEATLIQCIDNGRENHSNQDWQRWELLF